MWEPAKILKIGLFLGFIANSFFAQAITPVTINKETPQYIINVKYPQGFKNKEVDVVVKNYIDVMQKNFLNELSEDKDTPADAPGKTGLNITYTVPYESANALSVRFDVSIYHRGAAHPLNTVDVQNFIKGREVQLADLFKAGSNFLKPIADFCNKAITAKKISDEKWIEGGTKPILENYNTWSFSDKGIAIIFNNYQVAAYVYGDQKVEIPLSLIVSLIKPEVIKAVWSN